MITPQKPFLANFFQKDPSNRINYAITHVLLLKFRKKLTELKEVYHYLHFNLIPGGCKTAAPYRYSPKNLNRYFNEANFLWLFYILSMFVEIFKSIAYFSIYAYPDRGYWKKMSIFRYFNTKSPNYKKTVYLLLNCSYAYETWSNARY